MADTKITALTALTGADPANDVIPIVDVSDTTMAASGTTKKISVNNILGASGTATLASATISGDLTVDTNVLKVDTTLNRVGINNASPAQALDVAGSVYLSTNATYLYGKTSGGSATRTFGINAANDVYVGSIDQSISNIRFNSGGGDWAVLNSTGLGVGVASPAVKLDIGGAATQQFRIQMSGQADTRVISDTGAGIIGTYSNHRLVIRTNSADAVIVDASQNVGIGVTPSAWSSGGYFQLPNSRAFAFAGAAGDYISNGYFDGAWKYTTTAAVSRYRQDAGSHNWQIAPSGTAGNAITFTQAMTLDASGNLLVGKTAASVTTIGFQTLANGEASVAMAASTSASSTLNVWSTGAAAFRFYVAMNGTISATNTTISAISDARLKENVQDIDVGLGAILALKPRKFDWKEGKGKNIKGDRGFIAQEFEQVFPNLIDEWKDPAPEGEAPYKSVRQDLIPVLVKAIQELTARVQTLETR